MKGGIIKSIPKTIDQFRKKQRKEIQKLEQTLSIKELKDWYQIPKTSINYHSSLFSKHEKSLFLTLQFVYPQYKWYPWMFQDHWPTQYSNNMPYWTEKQHQVEFLDFLSKKLNIQTTEDWHKVNQNDFIDNHASSLLDLFNSSTYEVIQSVFPSPDLKRWRFPRLSSTYWKEKKNIQQFYEDLALKLNFKKLEDWYQVSSQDFVNHGGEKIYKQYDSYIIPLLDLYKDFNWKLWRFTKLPKSHLPKDFCKDSSNHLKFLQDFSNQFQINSIDDWYYITKKDLIQFGGKEMLDIYGSRIKTLTTLFPNYEWNMNKLNHSEGFWRDITIQKNFFDKLYIKLKLSGWKDWYRIRYAEVIQHGGAVIVNDYYGGSVLRALKAVYPHYEWDETLIMNSLMSPSKSQLSLLNVLQEMFDNEEIFTNFILNSSENDSTLKRVEFDIFIPTLSLAFEYQGELHYKDDLKNLDEDRKRRDLEKTIIAEKVGITLISIPYWWDRKSE